MESFAAVIRDITEQVKERQLIDRMLEEKELLVREMNHRVKNHIMLMESLIHLKSSPDTRMIDRDEVLRQTGAIGMIHDLLYINGGFDEINMDTYLPRLIRRIEATSPPGTISYETDLDDVVFDSRSAVTIGLIVNELVTNAVKYGQTGDGTSSVEVTVSLQADALPPNGYTLRVEDNGPPFPEDVDISSTDVSGLGLVHMLVKQLDGVLELQRHPSPTFTIRWRRSDR